MFQAMPGSPTGAVAIDDVVFDKGCVFTDITLPNWPQPPPACNASLQYQCLSDKKCIDRSRQCDGVMDCADSSDEKQCSCNLYCQNQGVCSIDTSGFRTCKCVNNYHGTRCSYAPDVTEPTTKSTTRASTRPTVVTGPTSQGGVTSSSTAPVASVTPQKSAGTGSDSDDSWKLPVGIVLGLLALVVIVTVVLVYLKRTNRLGNIRFQRFGRSTETFEDGGLSNPVYDYGTGGGFTALQEIEPPSFEKHEPKRYSGHAMKLQDAALSLDNPLYQDVTDA